MSIEREGRKPRWVPRLISYVALLGLGALAVEWGDGFDTSLSAGLSWGCYAIGGIAFGVLLAGFRSRGWRRWSVVLPSAAVVLASANVFAALNVWVIDARFRAYRSFYRGIEAGMSREQVFGLRDTLYPRGGDRMRPTVAEDSARQLWFFMDPEDSAEPNCEGIFLSMSGGRVREKSYSPD